MFIFFYFSDVFGYYYELFYDPDLRLPYILDRVECTSNELHLSQCNYIEYNDDRFSFRVTFVVKCQISGQSKLSDTIMIK